MLSFSHVSKTYAGGSQAVQDFTLELAHGELVVLIGPSGCGKTTTLRMVNRLIEPSDGTIAIDGRDYRTYNVVELRRSLGYVIQRVGLMPHLTIGENISFVLKLQGVAKPQREQRARELLEMVGMAPDVYLRRYPSELSGGQQQRIGVLRALAHDPEIILMDEPFGALDPITRTQLQDELKNLQQTVQKTILFVTHDMDEALRLADRIVIMRAGRIVQVAPPAEMLRDPEDDFVAQFIGQERRMRQASEALVGELQLKDAPLFRADVSVSHVLEEMRRRRFGTAVVTDTQGRLLGLVSERDLQKALQSHGASAVGSLGHDADLAVKMQEPALKAVQRMLSSGLQALPVVDDDGRAVSVVTRSALADQLEDALPDDADKEGVESSAGAVV